eukprot:8085980-Karenia_brevis.AAC.1
MWRAVKSKGLVMVDGKDLVSIDVEAQREDPVLFWKHSQIRSNHLDKQTICDAFHRACSSRPGEEELWCL